MAQLTWSRVPRRGFVASHWVSSPEKWSIWQYVVGSRTKKHRVARLLPGNEEFATVALAKRRAQELESRNEAA